MDNQWIENKIIENYVVKGMGQSAAGKEFNFGAYKVKKILKENNIKIRNHNQAVILKNKRFRKYDNNDNYFSIESKNMAYIMGFIAADGTIRKDSNEIKITLAAKDRVQLENIKKEIGIQVNVKDFTTKSGYDSCTLQWTSEQHKKDLKKYNIIPQKTFILTPPYQLSKEYWIDYIRGYFDGDGSINNLKNKSLRWQVCSATKILLEWILDYFEELGIPKVNIQERKNKNILYTIQYSTSSTKKIYDVLYTKGSLFLPRKKKCFDFCIDNKYHEAIYP